MLPENLKGLVSHYQFLFLFLFLIDLLLEDTHPIETASLRPLLAQIPNILGHAHEDNTIKNHMSAYEQWKNWATAFSLAVIPADSMSVALFLLNKIQMGGKFSIIKKLFYGIKFVHKFKCLPDPTKHAVVNNMHEASKRLCPSSNGKKQPITAAHIGLLYSELFEKSAMTLTTLSTFVMFVLEFCGFMRFSEIANIRRSDIIFCDSYIKIFIAHSKTDVYRDGKWIYICRSATKYCPVKNLEHYLQFGSILETSNEYIFPGIQNKIGKLYAERNPYRMHMQGRSYLPISNRSVYRQGISGYIV